jgi:hypothetical protein
VLSSVVESRLYKHFTFLFSSNTFDQLLASSEHGTSYFPISAGKENTKCIITTARMSSKTYLLGPLKSIILVLCHLDILADMAEDDRKVLIAHEKAVQEMGEYILPLDGI